MARYDTFTFRVNKRERKLIAGVAEKLQRSQSDAMRVALRSAAEGLGVEAEQGNEARGSVGGVVTSVKTETRAEAVARCISILLAAAQRRRQRQAEQASEEQQS